MGGDLYHFTGLHPAEPFGEVGFEIPHRHLACDYFRHTYSPICDHFSRFPRRCGAERSPGHQGLTAPPTPLLHPARRLHDQISKTVAPIDLALHERDPYGHIASVNLPQEFFNGDDFENIFNAVYSICEAWLFGSDAGLIHRTSVEIAALDQGHENSMWHHLIDSESSDTVEFKAICEFSLSDEKVRARP